MTRRQELDKASEVFKYLGTKSFKKAVEDGEDIYKWHHTTTYGFKVMDIGRTVMFNPISPNECFLPPSIEPVIGYDDQGQGPLAQRQSR